MPRYDALIIGAGIAGMESALNLANEGYQVLLVDKQPSIGGNMIALSKVFPTLDCASCITTPKMSESAHHENITIMTYTEVMGVRKVGREFDVILLKKARFVDEDPCTGCRLCEDACPVIVEHDYERGLGARKAISVSFTTAIPQVAFLDPESCIQCGKCYDACPTLPNSIRYDQEDEEVVVRAGSVVMGTGFKITDVDRKDEYYNGEGSNVVSAMQMERMLAPSGPMGSVLRPSDGKEPDNIAFVLCAGSRDHSIGVPYCSRVCCMYTIKQAMLLSGALPMADLTIYYMDIRAFGKNYEQFYQTAKAMGINFVKAKIARVTAQEDGDLEIAYEDQANTGKRATVNHDLVVLASGILPEANPSGIAPVDVDQYGFIQGVRPKTDPTVTKEDGIFYAGMAGGPKDIVDTILEAGSAAMKCTNYLKQTEKESGGSNDE